MPVKNDNYIYRMGTAPNTRAAVSQKNKVFSYSVGATSFQQIGAVSEFSFDESRTVDAIRGVGYGDMVAELVPSVTEPMTLTLNKTLLYAANIHQVLGYKGGIDGLVRSLRHHRWPFDLKQELVFSEISSKEEAVGPGVKNATPSGPGAPITTIKALFTFFEGCWLNNYSASFASDSAMIAENSSVTVTDIIDGVSQYGEFIDSGLSPGSSTAGAGQTYSIRFAGGTSPLNTGLGVAG
jgi:hypothetical protein